MNRLLLVIEGYGEVTAAPVLIRRLLAERLQIYHCEIETHRRHDLCHLRASNWDRLKRYAGAAYNEECPILWILDCDDDCAKDVALEMSNTVQGTNPRQPIAVALLPAEYETMFLYDIDTARTVLGLTDQAQKPTDPKAVRGAKGWLSRHMPRGSAYKETTDQARISSQLNLGLLEAQYRDFRHLVSALTWLSQQRQPGVYPISP